MPPKSPGPGEKNSGPTPVECLGHQDSRPNIPTEELRDFVAQDETTPGSTLYPRDPSPDPQLVWKGKDEQDQAGLAVSVVPIYIQEKIRPQALIENCGTPRAGASRSRNSRSSTISTGSSSRSSSTSTSTTRTGPTA